VDRHCANKTVQETTHMAAPNQQPLVNASLDKNNLYREESFTDLRAGTVKQFMPIKADGSCDPTRSPAYMGQTQIMSGGGPLPIQFMLEAKNLDEAIAACPAAAEKAVQELIEEARRIQLEAASRIVVPGQDMKSKLIL